MKMMFRCFNELRANFDVFRHFFNYTIHVQYLRKLITAISRYNLCIGKIVPLTIS